MEFLYFFILGHCPDLSIAEITSQVKGKIIDLSKNFLILETQEKLEIEKLQKKLGGTIKIGRLITSTKMDSLVNEFFYTDWLLKKLNRNKKIYFGFSFYGFDQQFKFKKLKPIIKNWALKIKKNLKEVGASSRWVESKETILSSVVVKKNKLLTNGIEFILLKNSQNENNQNQTIYIGQTLTCQEFEEYEKRDYGRPARNIEEGMIPPKLAKIMINLANISKEKNILDPFCGSGTIIQEAILMNYQNIIGTDLSNDAIKNSQKNINWLVSNSNFLVSKSLPEQDPTRAEQSKNLNVKIFQADVKEASKKLLAKSIDAIITEPYLGPIRLKNLELGISNLISELSNLYLKAFEEFKKILKKDGRVVIIFPIFRINNALYFLPILEELKKSGWQIINPTPKELKQGSIIKKNERNSIIYSRSDQTVLREIFMFEHTNS